MLLSNKTRLIIMLIDFENIFIFYFAFKKKIINIVKGTIRSNHKIIPHELHKLSIHFLEWCLGSLEWCLGSFDCHFQRLKCVVSVQPDLLFAGPSKLNTIFRPGLHSMRTMTAQPFCLNQRTWYAQRHETYYIYIYMFKWIVLK